ncbi:hypothetical protein OPIT5_25060 [Opitutaceae bacterium TAV5]|nr:hypothetical protein OPIT5_25060 [Opitutaceae bacterium TAV5]
MDDPNAKDTTLIVAALVVVLTAAAIVFGLFLFSRL